MENVMFVVTPNDQTLHELNETAAFIWDRAANGCTAEQAAAAMVDEFDVDLDTALKDVRACCEDLVSRQILLAEPA